MVPDHRLAGALEIVHVLTICNMKRSWKVLPFGRHLNPGDLQIVGITAEMIAFAMPPGDQRLREQALHWAEAWEEAGTFTLEVCRPPIIVARERSANDWCIIVQMIEVGKQFHIFHSSYHHVVHLCGFHQQCGNSQANRPSALQASIQYQVM